MSNYSTSEYHENENSNTPWQKVMSYVDPGTTLLDIGCSSGNFGAELISRKHCVVDGVELDASDVKLARKKLRKVTSFNIENGVPADMNGIKYDYVYYGDVIEHLVNPIVALQNTKQLLKPEGKLLFSIPNMSHISVRLAVIEGKFGYGETGLLDKTHLHFYDFKEIERVFDDAGYKIIKSDYILRDVPEDIIVDELATVGLTANEKFLNIARQTENVAYQVCGVAVPLEKGEHKVSKLPVSYPLTDEMDRHIKKLQDLHKEDIGRVRASYEQQLAEFTSFKASPLHYLWRAYKELRKLGTEMQNKLRDKK